MFIIILETIDDIFNALWYSRMNDMFNECIHNVNKDRLSVIFMMHHGWFQANKQKLGQQEVSMSYLVTVLQLCEVVIFNLGTVL